MGDFFWPSNSEEIWATDMVMTDILTKNFTSFLLQATVSVPYDFVYEQITITWTRKYFG